MSSGFSYRIFPLGDSALTIDFGNIIDRDINTEVTRRYFQLLKDPVPGMIEAIPAYSSVTVLFDPVFFKQSTSPGFERMKTELEKKMERPAPTNDLTVRHIRIPVCYEKEFGPDLEMLAASRGLSVDEVIQSHTGKAYRVYMLGFIPGFAYMGEVDDKIAMPRKTSPSIVDAGSVGIAGKQTGIYPLSSPGGWSIIGKTPLKLFDREREEPIFLNAGDEVNFYAINSDEFKNFQVGHT